MSENYTETTRTISNKIYNEILPEQFANSDIPDSEYSIVPIDDNFLSITDKRVVSDGTLTTIQLGTTIKSKAQILSLICSDAIAPFGAANISPDMYSLNQSRNAIVFANQQPAGRTFFIKILDGLFFTGITRSE